MFGTVVLDIRGSGYTFENITGRLPVELQLSYKFKKYNFMCLFKISSWYLPRKVSSII